ncbi:MAG: hypothetical protein JW896_05185, partial [Deltaproteobacteria bacterium]|nr:hypothetical protein [Deltaproteobacteria bacterium]
VGFEPTCPAINGTSRFRVDPVTTTSVPLRFTPIYVFSELLKKTTKGKHDHLPQTHTDLHGHFSSATCGTERVITLPREKPFSYGFSRSGGS